MLHWKDGGLTVSGRLGGQHVRVRVRQTRQGRGKGRREEEERAVNADAPTFCQGEDLIHRGRARRFGGQTKQAVDPLHPQNTALSRSAHILE